MLTCTDPQTFDGRIPSSLLDLYVRCKQYAKAVVAWLVSHGTHKYRRLQKLSIPDLFCLADIVQTKTVQMPDIIDFHFREAIAARTHLRNIYRTSTQQGLEDPDIHNREYRQSQCGDRNLRPSKAHTPRLMSDALEKAFEILRDIHVRTVSLNDIKPDRLFRRRWKIC